MREEMGVARACQARRGVGLASGFYRAAVSFNGRFDPPFDAIMAHGDPVLGRFSVPNRRLVGRKEYRIPSLVEKTVLAGLLASDLL
jgi:hypothetical protein